MRIIKKLSDDMYSTKVEFEIKTIHYPKNIKELTDHLTMINKLEKAVEKLKTLNEEELEIAHIKIMNYQGYSKEEKEYLKNQIINLLI